MPSYRDYVFVGNSFPKGYKKGHFLYLSSQMKHKQETNKQFEQQNLSSGFEFAVYDL